MTAIGEAGQAWTYKGVLIGRASMNSSGIRWYAIGAPGAPGVLKAQTKDGMRQMITHYAAHPAS